MGQRIVIISQARMMSTRLTGKVLKKVLGKTLLEQQIDRLRRSKRADDIVIATTSNDTDIPIVKLCEKVGIKHYRGPEEDVLARFYGAASTFKADVIIRVTADCPLIDPGMIDKAISFYISNQDKFDYVTTHSDNLLGMTAEIFSYKLLEEVHNIAKESSDREHVTIYIYSHPEKYRIKKLSFINDSVSYRWTVDTSEDFKLITRIFEALYPENANFSVEDVLSLMKKRPELRTINAHIRQKVYK